MAKKEILPAVFEYAANVADSIASIKNVIPSANTAAQEANVIEITNLYAQAAEKLAALEVEIAAVSELHEIEEEALAFKFKVFVAMQELRVVCDKLETIVADEFWPFPTYSDLLFRV